jgi:hypothetical protein
MVGRQQRGGQLQARHDRAHGVAGGVAGLNGAANCPYPLLHGIGATGLHPHRLIPGRWKHPFPQRLVMVAPSGERTNHRPPLLFIPCPVASPGAESMTHK